MASSHDAPDLPMLRFTTHGPHDPAMSWPPEGAHLLARDDLAIPGTLVFEDGCLVARPDHTRREPLALRLPWETGSVGRLVLQTSLLPQRDAPYGLSVELARHRIRTFLEKREEWQMFDLSDTHPAVVKWEESRRLLTDALVGDDPETADRVARGALELAVHSTERLAMTHAQILLHRRFGRRAGGSTILGVRVAPWTDDGFACEQAASQADLLVVPMSWRSISPSPGVERWAPIDRWIQWAQESGKPIIAGPLLDMVPGAVPDWVLADAGDPAAFRNHAYDHLERVVGRYGRSVHMWNLAAGLEVNEVLQLDPPRMIDLVRMAALVIRERRKKARVMLEITRPWGEHVAEHDEAQAPAVFIEQLQQEGVNLDAVGVRLLFGRRDRGLGTRDLMQISTLLDRLFLLDHPVLITAAGVPADTIDPEGGTWHEPWSPEHQAIWAARFFSIAMSKPCVETVVWSDLHDHGDALLARGGLIDAEGTVRPVLRRLVGARNRLRVPLGPLKIEHLQVYDPAGEA